MASLSEKLNSLWQNIKASSATIPLKAEIPDDHIIGKENMGLNLETDQHYFVVRVNEMYLTNSREWFNKIDPMVFFISEFNYKGEEISIPYIVGPSLMEKYGKKTPEGMIFSNTRVAGIHPYKGGKLNFSIILYQTVRTNYARKFLQILENTSNALDFSNSLSNYIKIGNVVVDGIESFLGLGDTNPLVGFRKEYDPNAGDKIYTRYFILMNTDEEDINVDLLWVKNDQLYQGENDQELKPFRKADYVLYNLSIIEQRNDVNTLSFYPLYQQMIKNAMEATTEQKWQATKAEMMTLAQDMRFHADLSKHHYEILREQYIKEMIKEREQAVLGSNLKGGDEADQEGRKNRDILDL